MPYCSMQYAGTGFMPTLTPYDPPWFDMNGQISDGRYIENVAPRGLVTFTNTTTGQVWRLEPDGYDGAQWAFWECGGRRYERPDVNSRYWDIPEGWVLVPVNRHTHPGLFPRTPAQVALDCQAKSTARWAKFGQVVRVAFAAEAIDYAAQRTIANGVAAGIEKAKRGY